MDGREARELWDAIKSYFERALAPVQRFVMKLAGKGAKSTFKMGGRFLKNRIHDIADHSGKIALQRVEKDGPNKNTNVLGEFDRKEAEEIVKMAQEDGVKIAIVERYLDEESKISKNQLSEVDMNRLVEWEKNIEEQKRLINKYSMSGMNETRKSKKIKDCNDTIEILQNNIKKTHDTYLNRSYTILVNAAQIDFINKVKDTVLDKDTKETIERLKKELFNRTHFEDVLNDFKDAEHAYTVAKQKEEELYKQKEEKQYEFDRLMRKKEKGGLPKEEMEELSHQIKIKGDELTAIKQEWADQVKIRDLAKETYEKKTFTGEFTKENIRKSKGNLSISMDKYDITHFPEGYATFKMTSDEYYNMISENQNQLLDMSYAAFKQTEHSDVELLCSSKDVEKFSNMVQTQTGQDIVVDIHQTGNNIELETSKSIATWELPLKDSQELQKDINLLTDYHQKNKGVYMMSVQRSKDGKPVIHVQSSLKFEEFQTYEKEMFEKRQKQQERKRDEHIRAIQSEKVYDYTDRAHQKTTFTKEQERQLDISSSFFMDKSSKFYDPNKQQFLESNNLSAMEMQAFTNGFVQDLTVQEAEGILKDGVNPDELADFIGELLDKGKQR